MISTSSRGGIAPRGMRSEYPRSSTTNSAGQIQRSGATRKRTDIVAGVLPSCAKTLPAGYFENGTGRPEGAQRGAEYGGDGGCRDGAASIASDPVRRAVRAARPSTAARSSSPLRPPITRSFTFDSGCAGWSIMRIEGPRRGSIPSRAESALPPTRTIARESGSAPIRASNARGIGASTANQLATSAPSRTSSREGGWPSTRGTVALASYPRSKNGSGSNASSFGSGTGFACRTTPIERTAAQAAGRARQRPWRSRRRRERVLRSASSVRATGMSGGCGSSPESSASRSSLTSTSSDSTGPANTMRTAAPVNSSSARAVNGKSSAAALESRCAFVGPSSTKRSACAATAQRKYKAAAASLMPGSGPGRACPKEARAGAAATRGRGPLPRFRGGRSARA